MQIYCRDNCSDLTDGNKCFEKAFNAFPQICELIQFVISNSLWVCPEVREKVVNDNIKRIDSSMAGIGAWYPYRARCNGYKSKQTGCKHHISKADIIGDDNTYANQAIKRAIFGYYNDSIIDWDTCHIYDECIRCEVNDGKCTHSNPYPLEIMQCTKKNITNSRIN